MSYEETNKRKIILDKATYNKGKNEKFITKFSRIYIPIVIIIALILVIVPLLLGLDFKDWLTRALVFLLVSCPYSIVISIPLVFFYCIRAISKKGVLIKGTKHIENLAKAKIIAFDKTGTITTGKMRIANIVRLSNYSEEEMMSYMYALERNSNHPISTAICNKIKTDKIEIENYNVENYKEIAGHGISAKVNNNEILFGNKRLLEDYILNEEDREIVKNRLRNLPNVGIFLTINGDIVGYIILQEELRDGISKIVENLNKIGIKKTIILTGDNKENANKINKVVGVSNIYSGLLPQEKMEILKDLKKEGKVIFVGAGMTDEAVLDAADFSIVMGKGTEIEGSTADSILISDNISSIVNIIEISRRSMRIAKFNIVFSLFLKLIILILGIFGIGIFGIAPIWTAIFADVGVTLITVINSIRIN